MLLSRLKRRLFVRRKRKTVMRYVCGERGRGRCGVCVERKEEEVEMCVWRERIRCVWRERERKRKTFMKIQILKSPLISDFI